MRRILPILVAATLLMVLVAGSTAASTSKLVDAHALVALDGVPVGWVDAHLTTPTVGDPSPGVIEFTPLADSGLPTWMAIVEVANFYRDVSGTPSAVAASMQCVWDWPGTYACAEIQVWMLDGRGTSESDWFVTAPEGGGGNDQTWYQVVKGEIKVEVP
jgi:hypothetical protein